MRWLALSLELIEACVSTFGAFGGVKLASQCVGVNCADSQGRLACVVVVALGSWHPGWFKGVVCLEDERGLVTGVFGGNEHGIEDAEFGVVGKGAVDGIPSQSGCRGDAEKSRVGLVV